MMTHCAAGLVAWLSKRLVLLHFNPFINKRMPSLGAPAAALSWNVDLTEKLVSGW